MSNLLFLYRMLVCVILKCNGVLRRLNYMQAYGDTHKLNELYRRKKKTLSFCWSYCATNYVKNTSATTNHLTLFWNNKQAVRSHEHSPDLLFLVVFFDCLVSNVVLTQNNRLILSLVLMTLNSTCNINCFTCTLNTICLWHRTPTKKMCVIGCLVLVTDFTEFAFMASKYRTFNFGSKI